LHTVICCQSGCDGLDVTTVPQTKAAELTALLMEIMSGSGLSCSVPVVVCHSIPIGGDIPVALQAMSFS